MAKLLLVDDDEQISDSTRRLLEMEGHAVTLARDGSEALERARTTPFDAILSDVRMPGMTGLEFLKAFSLLCKETPVLLMTAYGTVEDAVWAMKMGAVDFLEKPFKRQQLLSALDGALARKRVSSRTLTAPGSPLWLPVGESETAQHLRSLVEQVAPTSATILLTGESGTGKELIARAIHERSARAKGKFIALNCAAMPASLIESELFGYEKGAFTGATQSREGLFEAANGGTLLLDEIGDMPMGLQASLLRTLQEREVRRVGSTQARKIDVRVLAATHRELRESVKAGAFREDLLFRLEVVSIVLPPLRDRKEDILPLARHFLLQASSRHGKTVLSLSSEALAALQAHIWPGNIRELSNVIERAVIFAKSETLELADLPAHLQANRSDSIRDALVSFKVGTPLREIEDVMIRKTLEVADGDKETAARLLGINSRTIYRKLEEGKLKSTPLATDPEPGTSDLSS